MAIGATAELVFCRLRVLLGGAEGTLSVPTTYFGMREGAGFLSLCLRMCLFKAYFLQLA